MGLVLENVRFKYGQGKCVLDSVSFEAQEGELVSVVGRTGSGKTTLGLVMAGLFAPTEGRVAIKERSAPAGLDVVMVFQFPESQFFEETVFLEVAYGPICLGLGAREVRERVEASLQKLGLDAKDFSERSPLTLSEGERRRVAIASALSCEPRFLILDEPTVSLDWEAAAHIFDVLRELKSGGVSVVVMTHDVEDTVFHSDRVAVLEGGKILDLGKPAGGIVNEIYGIFSPPRRSSPKVSPKSQKKKWAGP